MTTEEPPLDEDDQINRPNEATSEAIQMNNLQQPEACR